MHKKMMAAVFVAPNRIVLDEKTIPDVGLLEALVRVMTTMISGTEVHILKGGIPSGEALLSATSRSAGSSASARRCKATTKVSV